MFNREVNNLLQIQLLLLSKEVKDEWYTLQPHTLQVVS